MRYISLRPTCRDSFVPALATALILSSFLGLLFISADAQAHIDDNLIGVPPSPSSEWQYYGIGAEESKKWIEEGIIFAQWAAQWKGE